MCGVRYKIFKEQIQKWVVTLLSVVPLKIGKNNYNPGETYRENAVSLQNSNTLQGAFC